MFFLSVEYIIVFDEEEEIEGMLFLDWFMDIEEEVEVLSVVVYERDFVVILYIFGFIGLLKGV